MSEIINMRANFGDSGGNWSYFGGRGCVAGVLGYGGCIAGRGCVARARANGGGEGRGGCGSRAVFAGYGDVFRGARVCVFWNLR